MIAFWPDLHLGKMTALLGMESGLKLHARMLRRLLRDTRDVGATRVAMLGDLFATPFPSEEEKILMMETLSGARDLKFLAFPGNHDKHDAENNSLKLLCKLPGVGALRHVHFSMQPELVKFDGLLVSVVPYGFKIPRVASDLVLFHDTVVGAKRDNRSVAQAGEGINPAVFGTTMAVSGHLHTPQRVGRYVFYPGTGAQFSFGEEERKLFCWLDDDGKIRSRRSRLPWKLKVVEWSSDRPPRCDEPDVFYKLRIGEDHPGPGWMARHPQVLGLLGSGKSKTAQQDRDKIVRIMSTLDPHDDSKMMVKFLATRTNLDRISVAQAMKIHRRLSGG